MNEIDDADRSLIEKIPGAADTANLHRFDEVTGPGVRARPLPDGWKRGGGDGVARYAVVTDRTMIAGVAGGTLTGRHAGFASARRRFEIDEVAFAHARDAKVEEFREHADTGRAVRGNQNAR